MATCHFLMLKNATNSNFEKGARAKLCFVLGQKKGRKKKEKYIESFHVTE